MQRNTDEILTECLTCHSNIPLWELGDHKIHCSTTHSKNGNKLFVTLLATLWKNISLKLNVKNLKSQHVWDEQRKKTHLEKIKLMKV